MLLLTSSPFRPPLSRPPPLAFCPLKRLTPGRKGTGSFSFVFNLFGWQQWHSVPSPLSQSIRLESDHRPALLLITNDGQNSIIRLICEILYLFSSEHANVMGERSVGAIGAAAGGPEGMPPPPLQEVLQHGTIGNFLGSSLEGVESGFIRCVYTAKNRSANTVTLLCEKMEGCCLGGCCPKDQFWMTGLMILLVFVLLLLCIGTIVMLICYQRSKVQQRRTEKELYEATNFTGGGARGMPPGAELAHSGGIYSRPMYGTTSAGPAQSTQLGHHQQQQSQQLQQQHYAASAGPMGGQCQYGAGGGTATRRF
ncbi:hypothetical protein niasHT_038845 [Heterodera trifolii]|uniref:Uncharacterized protein n=2 Tax=Heterodera TaxID=34509 RepID=A0ABD2I1S9_9BILA